VFLGFQFRSARLGNPKVAAHVAVGLQCWSLFSSNAIHYFGGYIIV